MKKKIRINFSGMGGRFDPSDNFIINTLKKRYDVELSDKPDYLFYSVNSRDYLNYDRVRIFYTAENLVPDFNICDYAIGFNHISFADRYMRYPLYLVDDFNAYQGDDYASDLKLALHKHENAEDQLRQKTGFCSFVYSNADAVPCRQLMFEKLSEYKHINSGGRYLNNIGGPVESKINFQKKHKFVIAFENTSTPGYTTEKIVHAFAAGAIPIYWGNPEINKEFNEASFINCHKYGLTEKGESEAIERIVDEVKRLDNDDEEYLKMLNTPAFTVDNDVDKQKKVFEEFLFNIFDQDKEKAYRRNRFYWGKRYERKQKIGNWFYWQCSKLIPLRNKVTMLLGESRKEK